MAKLLALQEEIELELRLLEKEYDPFQLDLEWFKYELALKIRRSGQPSLPDTRIRTKPAARLERHAARGKINRKDLADLLSGLDGLILRAQEMRFEPYDLNFYMEWKLETPHVYSIVTWFDMALSPRDLKSRFPSAHLGFRFLTEEDSLRNFRSGLEIEFIGSAPVHSSDAPPLVN
jgi:hypothetical protein